MTTWRHSVVWGGDTYCAEDVYDPATGLYGTCLCIDPTPDPASPCGYCTDNGGDSHRMHSHPYRPTRCTCGHPIEATR